MIADSPDDFTAVNTHLLFEPMESRECVQIFIEDDDSLEQQESFSVTIEKPEKLHDLVEMGISSREIVIANDDSKWHTHPYVQPILTSTCELCTYI